MKTSENPVDIVLRIFDGIIVKPVIKNNRTTYVPVRETKKQKGQRADRQTPSLF
jgi:predicted TIM-barrel enzyme